MGQINSDSSQTACIVCNASLDKKNPYTWQCPKCGFWSAKLDAGVGRGIDGIEALRRSNFVTICDQLERHGSLSGKRVLEIGCAEGWFLNEASKRGAVVVGIEPSDVAEIARAAGHKVHVGFFPDVLGADEKFDYIVFNDVFEHLPDPSFILEACAQTLSVGGTLVINLPSSNGFFFKMGRLFDRFGVRSLFDRLWQKGFASPHLWYFNERTLDAFVTKSGVFEKTNGFELEVIRSEGLKERISASHQGIVGVLMTYAIRLLIPVIKAFPSDIIVQTYKKKSTETGSH